jgi:DNA-binding response OmpR family regulator
MAGRVLIIEDDEPFCKFLCKALGRANFDSRSVADGTSALECAAIFKPDYIVLDMHLPGMDGWKFITEYFNTPDAHAAIIVSTAATLDPQTLPGITAYLQKPYTFAQLLSLLSGPAN